MNSSFFYVKTSKLLQFQELLKQHGGYFVRNFYPCKGDKTYVGIEFKDDAIESMNNFHREWERLNIEIVEIKRKISLIEKLRRKLRVML